MTGTPPPRLCLPVHQWPELDRERWRLAQEPAGFLEPDRPAGRWSPASRAIVAQAYGQWLVFLARQGALDPLLTPGERASEEQLRAFAAALDQRAAPVTTAMIVGALQRMFVVLEPEHDWTALARAYRHLKRHAAPSRGGLSRLVPAADLFDLGIALMETAATKPGLSQAYRATRYRDGLLIAVLICCPIRLRNLAGLVIGRHLIFDGGVYGLRLTIAETKNGRPYGAELPPELTAYLDHYLQLIRMAMQAIARGCGEAEDTSGRLWLDRRGRPMSTAAIQKQLEIRTRQAFGRVISPHTFRHCAVTELVDLAPEQIGLAADLLGHANFRTTRKHYIHAQGMTAHARVQAMIQKRRSAAVRKAADA